MGGPYGRPESSLNAIKSSFSLLWDYLSSLLTRSVARSALQARIPRDYLASLLTRSVARSALQARIPRDYLASLASRSVARSAMPGPTPTYSLATGSFGLTGGSAHAWPHAP